MQNFTNAKASITLGPDRKLAWTNVWWREHAPPAGTLGCPHICELELHLFTRKPCGVAEGLQTGPDKMVLRSLLNTFNDQKEAGLEAAG